MRRSGILGMLLLAMLVGPAWADPSFVAEGVVEAPMAEVWKVWSTADGYRSLGAAHAEVDLRLGGLIRSHYSAEGVLGDEETITNRILAFEDPRMIAIRIDQPPKSFPFKEAWKSTWTVVTMTEAGAGKTHVRIASMGYGDDDESKAMREFFERGNAWTLQTLQAHFAGTK